jgi:putative addiction module component (TIGR02574 family)
MTTATRQVLQDAMNLTPMERAELIDALLQSFNRNPDQRLIDAWKVEAESRIDAFEANELTDDSADGVFARINRR